MKIAQTFLLTIVLPIVLLAQDQDDALALAKLGFIEKLHAAGTEHFRRALTAKGFSSEDADEILFQAFDEYSKCVLVAVRDQAREQGLPEDIVLKGFGGKTRGKEESLILLSLDTDAVKTKQAPCDRDLNDGLMTEGP